MLVFKEVEDVDQVLKSLLLKSFNEKYYTSFKNTFTRFSNVTTLDILLHLYSTHGCIKDKNLKENTKKLIHLGSHYSDRKLI